jgi:hypothetical protein
VDLGLGLATFFGRNWARLLLMTGSVIAIVGAFVATAQGGPQPTLGAGLPAVALSILTLLALSSHRARDYATRNRARPPGLRPGAQASAPAASRPAAEG